MASEANLTAMDGPARRLSGVQAAIAKAARHAGRNPQDVTLIAVSKTHGAEMIRPVIAAGQRHFGENRVQEAQAKWPALKAQAPDVVLHLIGALQSNKAEDAVRLFDVIHALDREKLAAALSAAIKKLGRTPQLFVQVNTGEEPQKAGIAPNEAVAFVTSCREVHGLSISGLMCIPPEDEEPAMHFALLAKLAGQAGVAGLSMGMSGDFETAIALGATHVRVGTAIFGARGKVAER
ncbi:MAG TPA: YggS family pyridoxal phosphate-dependent enzyme [Micropepsaceae bacterium]|nr:YggS family pyridoxal phosphate-dependent enzyme [Micropepsaceae bacterium]